MIWYDGTWFWVPPCCSQLGCFPPNMGLHQKDIAVEKVSRDDNCDKSKINCTGDRTKTVVCLSLHTIVQLSTLSMPAAFAANLASLLSLHWSSYCTALLSCCCAGWLLPFWDASVADIFAAHPSFGWLMCSPSSLASSHHHHQWGPLSLYTPLR